MLINKKDIKKILVLRYRSIGDIVLAYPTLEALRNTYPDARLDLVVDDTFREVCHNWTIVDRLFLNIRNREGASKYSKFWNELKFIWKIQRERYNLVVDLHCGPRSATLAFLSLAKYRIGNKLRLRNKVLYNIFPEPAGSGIHSVDVMLSLIAPLNPVMKKKKNLFFAYSDESRGHINALLERMGVGEGDKFAVVHPGARVDFKMLPPRTLGEVVGYIVSEFGVKVMLVGSDSEITAISEVAQASGRKCGVATNLSIGQLAALMDRSEMFIGNDSGPMHIASALGKPVVAFFGPSDPKIWGPWNNKGKVVNAPAMECMPCDQKGCHLEPEHCMSKIKVANIKRAVASILKKSAATVGEE
jgi:predicted lipopolysaccharide heptosyltransferase III